MSLRMQVEKKKAHEEMRRIMIERKKHITNQSKIDNPLAKYNKAGQLMCMLCSSIVRSENVWQVHINSKQHKENVEQAKKLKELTNNFTAGKIKNKRPGAPLNEAPANKMIKGILKNAGTPTPLSITKTNINHPKNSTTINLFHDEEIIRSPLRIQQTAATSENKDMNAVSNSNTKNEFTSQSIVDTPIPEGFFDDPILDAKVRNIEYKDPIEEEWEKFQKEIKEEASASAEIIDEEQQEATAERQIDEIDEQMRNWSRVLDLQLQIEETIKKKQDTDLMSQDENDSDIETDFDEYLDWRAKKSY